MTEPCIVNSSLYWASETRFPLGVASCPRMISAKSPPMTIMTIEVTV